MEGQAHELYVLLRETFNETFLSLPLTDKHLQLFWAPWYHNLLMPAAFFRILACLLRRRLFPYPTVKELQARRREAGKQ